jgi:acetyl esterase/lipase
MVVLKGIEMNSYNICKHAAKSILTAVVLMISSGAMAQEIIHLYAGPIPNAKVHDVKEVAAQSASPVIRKVINPTLELYMPEKEKSTGTAVVICPGGSYKVIVYQGEGVRTAKEFAQRGVAAFVLKYRLPNDSLLVDKKIGPLQDVQQAIKLIRENASKWGVNVNRVGIVGFSAGGHLAASGATRYKEAFIENSNKTSLRPDFQILVYPVISMQDSLTHKDSRRNLLGENPTKQTITLFSNELQIDADTPPAYITHTADDNVVDVDNSIVYFEKLRHHKVPVEMHIYPKGGHGFIFGRKGWMEPLFEWMKDSKLIN